MSDSGDKTEQASSKRLQQARDKGQIARAKEFTTAISIIVAVFYFTTYGNEIKLSIMEIFQTAFSFDRTFIGDHDQMRLITGSIFFLLIKIFAPLMLIQYLVSFISSSVLGGLSFNFTHISPKFSKLNPLAGFKRIFSSQTMVEFIKNVIKISLIFAILYYMLSTNIGFLSGLRRASFDTVSSIAIMYIIKMITMLVSVSIIFGLIDIPYQKLTFNKQMRMSKEELKQEHKQNEGNPQIKGRIRQIQMQNARRVAAKTVPTADVILMNPTHYAVALKYDMTKAEAPFVVAKGKNEVAFYIRELATSHDIEVLTIPDLTRSIYHTTQIDQMIPNQLFVAVAHVLNYVNQLRAWKNGSHAKPNSLPSFTIPEKLRY